MGEYIPFTEYLTDDTNDDDVYTLRILKDVGTSLNISNGEEYPVYVYKARHPDFIINPFVNKDSSKNIPNESTSTDVPDIKGKGKAKDLGEGIAEVYHQPPKLRPDEEDVPDIKGKGKAKDLGEGIGEVYHEPPKLRPDEEEDQYELLYVKYAHRSRQPRNYEDVRRQVKLNPRVPDHENILGKIREPFIHDGSYYTLVFPFMNQGSLRSVMKGNFRYGLPENFILFVLRETLNGLSFIHQRGHFHREINAGHIFFSDNPTPQIKLGFSASVFDLNEDIQYVHPPPNWYSRTFICEWASAPEAHRDYTAQSDVWLIGILALELVYGGIRVENRPALDSIVNKIVKNRCLPKKEKKQYLLGKSKEAVKSLNANMGKALKEKSAKAAMGDLKEAKKNLKVVIGDAKRTASRTASDFFPRNPTGFSREFSTLVAECLETNPSRRPTVAELLGRDIFNNLQTVLPVSNEETKN